MYAIIYWVKDSTTIFVYDMGDRELKVFDTLREADSFAESLERTDGISTRVISISAVSE